MSQSRLRQKTATEYQKILREFYLSMETPQELLKFFRYKYLLEESIYQENYHLFTTLHAIIYWENILNLMDFIFFSRKPSLNCAVKNFMIYLRNIDKDRARFEAVLRAISRVL